MAEQMVRLNDEPRDDSSEEASMIPKWGLDGMTSFPIFGVADVIRFHITHGFEFRRKDQPGGHEGFPFALFSNRLESERFSGLERKLG